nr:MAG TPA: hypothetical protein [Caudoviricetes sp.]
MSFKYFPRLRVPKPHGRPPSSKRRSLGSTFS